jgi:hypothetical protein
MRRLDHCSQRQYNRSNLDRNIEKVAQILEVRLVEDQILHVETCVCVWGRAPVLGRLHEVRRSFDAVVQPVESMSNRAATLFGAWGLGEIICACMRVSCL